MNSFNQITRIASLLLAIGFFYACSSSKPTVDELVAANSYDQALEQLNAEIEKTPDAPSLHFRKGQLLGEWAKSINNDSSSVLYDGALDAFSQSTEQDPSDDMKQKVETVVDELWQHEYQEGTKAYEEKQLTSSIRHFEHAKQLLPTRIEPYQSQSVAHFENKETNKAIDVLETAITTCDEIPAGLYQNLGYLYIDLQSPVRALYYYELANIDVAKNKNLAFGLINAFINTERTEEASEWLSKLLANYPEDDQILNVYGTQLYGLTMETLDDLIAAYRQDNQDLVTQIRFEAEALGEQAEQHLTRAFARDTANARYIESLAVFYNNTAGKYLSVSEVAFESDKPGFEERAMQLLNFAILYYEKLQREQPENDLLKEKVDALKLLQSNRSN